MWRKVPWAAKEAGLGPPGGAPGRAPFHAPFRGRNTMRSVIRRRIPGGHRVLPARGFALMAGVAVALVPGLVLASSAQATPRHQASARAGLPHVTRTQSRDSGPAVHHDRSLPLRVTAARAHAHP